MKRFIIASLMLGLGVMFTGCGEETKKETTATVKTPTGTDKVTETVKETKTGDAKTTPAKP